MGSGHTADMGRGARGNSADTQGQPNSVIDGEYEDLDDEPNDPKETVETDERKLTGPDTSDPKSSPWRK